MRTRQRPRPTFGSACVARERPPTYGRGPSDAVGAAVAGILAGDERRPAVDGELAELAATLRAVDRLSARAVALAGGLDGRRAAAEEGMSVDAALRLHTGAVRSDVSMVLTAAEVLAGMPAVAGLFAAGVLSWGHVRALVAGARRLDVAARAELDAHLGTHAERLAAMDPDRRSWALEDALADHRPERDVERRAQREAESEFVAIQGRLDGSGSLYGEFASESFATIAERLAAEADTPRATPPPGDQDGPAEPVPTRSNQLAAALVRICGRRADEAGGSMPVRFSVVVDLDHLTDRAAGQIATAVRGRPPRVVRRALERLGCDAALDVVVRDGTDLLAAQRYAPEVTAATRRAVTARDGGCRFPGCTAPASWCDVHHVQQRAARGDHAVSNLVLLCRSHHTAVHRRGWAQILAPDGRYTVRRRGRTWTTLPRRDQQLPPPERAGPAPRDPTGARDRPAGYDPGTRSRTGNSPDPHHQGEALPF
jgi:hypothetical protein